MMFIKTIYRLYVIRALRVYYPLSILNRFKVILMRSLGTKIGKNLFAHQGIYISSFDKLRIGDNCVLSKGVTIIAAGEVVIGDNVLIGYDSKILTKNHIIPSDLDMPIRFSGHTKNQIIIENDVWIASNVIILPGVRIRKGCVIAAGAIVNKDTEEYSVYGGIPAKLIRKR